MRIAWMLLLASCVGQPGDPAGEACLGLDRDGDGRCDHDRADWSAEATIPLGTHRADIFGLGEVELDRVRRDGSRHANVWPIGVSGLLLPYDAMMRVFADEAADPATVTLQQVSRTVLGFGTISEMYDWLGLARFPDAGEGIYDLTIPQGLSAGDAMGAGAVATEGADGLSFSCSACHAGNLFGRTVFGMTNRSARANEFFHLAQSFYPDIEPALFQAVSDATPDELELFVRTQQNLSAIGARVPEVRGLDTALAQVGLSLSRREADAWATFSDAWEVSPRPNGLQDFVSDSKPAVWWTAKYKTRWLSDGSVISGNPIFTNFLWNEIGRATDLHELADWLHDNQAVVDELTVAVFATQPPLWTDFFPADGVDVEAARRGQGEFASRCASCHGTYEKAWDQADAASLEPTARLRTTRVLYHERTPVMEVGTDPQRAQGMQHFADALNGLQISQDAGTVIEVQAGYVPPPLDGVWARYPYLHNGSVPTLCALLSPAAERPATFDVGPSDDAATDFDADCVGFPLGEDAPLSWSEDPRRHHDTTRPGLSNMGHEDMLDGLGAEARDDLITFLKTL